MSINPTAAIATLIRFQRDIADLRTTSQILGALGATGVDLGCDAVAVLDHDGGAVEVAWSLGAPPEVSVRARDGAFLDARIGEVLFDGLVPGGHVQTHLLVSAGKLFGALVLAYRSEPGQLRDALARALADTAALGVDRCVTTGELEASIAKLEASQAELARVQTLEALGKMAAVVAHEVRNPLASIGGALQVLRSGVAADDPSRPVFDKVLERLGDLDGLLTELLGFARPSEPRREPIPLRDVVAESLAAMLQDPARGEIAVTLTGDAPTVQGDRAQLRGVFDNLALNAFQAMEGRGRLDVEIQSAFGRCTVSVRDTGPGIPHEVRDSLFQPFVTTKVRGTGLGLAMVARTVERHAGSITAECPEGGGTRFALIFPTL